MSDVTSAPATVKVERHSPCIGICRLDEATGWCEGCGRSGAEIANWMDADDTARLAIWSELPGRIARFGTDTRVLPWTSDELIALAARQLSDTQRTWSIGLPTTDRLFALQPDGSRRIEPSAGSVIARSATQRFSLAGHPKLRGFAAVPGDTCMAFGIPKGRAVLPRAEAIAHLGPDERAIDGKDRMRSLFDLGIGTPTLRVSLRTADALAEHWLAEHAGTPWPPIAGTAANALATAPVTLVVETILARLETDMTGAEAAAVQSALGEGPPATIPAALVPAWAAPMVFAVHPPSRRLG
jgi:predicted Fe-S protein YdhL (DUF1289 family)